MPFTGHIPALLRGEMTESTISKNMIIKNTSNTYYLEGKPN
jgi:hypothetical protein